MDKSFSNGNGQSTFNAPAAMNWARELMARDPSSWTLTIGEDPR